MDPDYAAALASSAANAPAAYQSASPTIEELRAAFVHAVTIPNKKYHEERLPPGELLCAGIFYRPLTEIHS